MNQDIRTGMMQQEPEEFRFRFTGKGSEYFAIWIVNLLLSIITLGIYSAWAKVRREQYFHRNTLLDEQPFEYTGDPVRILLGRIVALVAIGAGSVLQEVNVQLALSGAQYPVSQPRIFVYRHHVGRDQGLFLDLHCTVAVHCGGNADVSGAASHRGQSGHCDVA